MIKQTINKGLLIFAIQQHMNCKKCHNILDVDRAVHAEAREVAPASVESRPPFSFVLCSTCWDDVKDVVRETCEKRHWALELIDGRELKGVRAPR